jgi:hypothetical protein
MVNPSNHDLGPGEDNPESDGPKLPQPPKEEAEGKDRRDELTDEEFDKALLSLSDFSRRDPWEQEHAPPVNRELVRRYVRDELSDEENRKVIELLCRWENWHKAEGEEFDAYLAEQLKGSKQPPDLG